jgi:hypothetical protein
MADDSYMVQQLADGVRNLGASGVSDPAAALESYLSKEMSRFTPRERLRLLEMISLKFDSPEPSVISAEEVGKAQGGESDEVTCLVSLFLGKSINPSELNSKEVADKFAASLNTLFDALNEIVSVINVTLLGQHPELETIRKVIGSNMEEGAGVGAIKDYLHQIKQAFHVAHSSFQTAASTLVEEILTELDPALISQTKLSGLKFGPLRKAELFDLYEERHARCKRWFSSGQCGEKLLRNFERNCQQTYKLPKR